MQYDAFSGDNIRLHDLDKVIVRDCARAWKSLLSPRSEKLAGFSLLGKLLRAINGETDPGLSPAFWVDMIHLVRGIEGNARFHSENEYIAPEGLEIHGPEAAKIRSDELDKIGFHIQERLERYESGLSPDSLSRRRKRKKQVLFALSGTAKDWNNWKWHVRHIATQADQLASIAPVTRDEIERVRAATETAIPFGVTPYYASLFDDDCQSGRDRAIRAQVIPPQSYIESFHDKIGDYMLEVDTSPVELITRRYPQILILKPFNS